MTRNLEAEFVVKLYQEAPIKKENVILTFECPIRSPDANPTEDVSGLMKLKLQRKMIKSTRNSMLKNRGTFGQNIVIAKMKIVIRD